MASLAENMMNKKDFSIFDDETPWLEQLEERDYVRELATLDRDLKDNPVLRDLVDVNAVFPVIKHIFHSARKWDSAEDICKVIESYEEFDNLTTEEQMILARTIKVYVIFRSH